MELYSHEMQQWIDKETKKRTLTICGEGGLGKTEMAKAILASFGKYFFIDSLDTVKTLLFIYWSRGFADDVTVTALHRFHSGRVGRGQVISRRQMST